MFDQLDKDKAYFRGALNEYTKDYKVRVEDELLVATVNAEGSTFEVHFDRNNVSFKIVYLDPELQVVKSSPANSIKEALAEAIAQVALYVGTKVVQERQEAPKNKNHFN